MFPNSNVMPEKNKPAQLTSLLDIQNLTRSQAIKPNFQTCKSHQLQPKMKLLS